MTTQTSTTRLASNPSPKSPATHIITIIPIPQPSIMMTNLPRGVLTDARARSCAKRRHVDKSRRDD